MGCENVAHDQCNWLLRFKLYFVDIHFEVAQLGRQFGLCRSMNELFIRPSMSDQLLDGNDLKPMFLGKRLQFVSRGTIA